MRKIIKELKAQKEQAFEEVYYRYHRLIFFVAFSIIRDKGHAEEIVQDTFIKMFKNINQYKGRGEFKSWLVNIARNLSRNELKKKRTVDNKCLYDDDLVNTDFPSKGDSNLFFYELKKILNDFQFKIILMHVIYGFTFKKIALELNSTDNIVKKTYYNAIEILKKYYEDK